MQTEGLHAGVNVTSTKSECKLNGKQGHGVGIGLKMGERGYSSDGRRDTGRREVKNEAVLAH